MPHVTPDQITRDLETIIRRLKPEHSGDIRATDRLRDDLGLDSLHSMELLSEVTEKYEVDIDVEQVQDVRTVGDVVQFLAGVLA
ncbi:MAG: acyl carrier protein [Myxococcales bacterium]|nr:acyl carrier protein [Myxococcales bacterium]MBL8722130.1 acyl carrier protein [Myxococcales bacterium]